MTVYNHLLLCKKFPNGWLCHPECEVTYPPAPASTAGGMCVWCKRTTAREGGERCPVSPMCDQMVYSPVTRGADE